MQEISFEAIEADLEALSLELNAQCLAIRKGLQHNQRTGAIFAEHPLATSLEAIAFLKRTMEGDGSPDLRERAGRLYYASIGHFIRLDLLMMDETMDRFLLQVGIEIDGERLTFADMVPWLIGQPDFQRREMLGRKALPLLRRGGELRARIWDGALWILREDFGYPNYARFCEEKKGIDLGGLAAMLQNFLDSTDEIYGFHMSTWVERAMSRPFHEMSRYHAIYLLHLRGYDHGFPTSQLMAMLRRNLEALGIEHALGRRILVDMEDRKGKSALSRCVPLRIPEEIHVTIKSTGGLSDYEAVLHEMGHALQFAYTEASLPYPYRHLQRSFSLTETFGFLLQNLTLDPVWLSTYTRLSEKEIESLVYYRTLKLLCLVRRYVGKFLFEHELFSRGDLQGGESYARWLSRATGFVYEPEAAFMDMEEEFYSADYLRGWIGEAALRGHLKKTFGDDWFMKRKAGRFLVDLWREGEKWSLDDLLERLGLDPLGLAPFQQTFAKLAVPTTS